MRAGLLPWTPKLAAAASELVADMQSVDLPALQAAVVAEASTRMTAMFDGITAYQNAPRPAERRTSGPRFPGSLREGVP